MTLATSCGGWSMWMVLRTVVFTCIAHAAGPVAAQRLAHQLWVGPVDHPTAAHNPLRRNRLRCEV